MERKNVEGFGVERVYHVGGGEKNMCEGGEKNGLERRTCRDFG
jgi:hypothetical protein